MNLIIREYIASLRERDELDAVLPDLLSELGFNVISRPGRGTKQYGVDIAAVGPSPTGERCVYLFSVKKGDLTRQDWNSGDQALRPSLDEIQDVYIPNSIPAEFSGIKVVICLCFGGVVKEVIRSAVSNYERRNTTDRLSFEEWNGDKIAGLISEGILREEILPKGLRSHFQKAVALVDEPDVAYAHFKALLTELRALGIDGRSRVRVSRQIYICLWILFVWARDANNVEAAFRSCELSILNVWELTKPLIDQEGPDNESVTIVLLQLIELYQTMSHELLGTRILPHAKKLHSLSVAVHSRTPIDVNLKLFDLLGGVSIAGLMLSWIALKFEIEDSDGERKLAELVGAVFDMIENNPALMLPCHDGQSTSIALFLMLCLTSGAHRERLEAWLTRMATRLDFTVQAGTNYPTTSSGYEDLLSHPRNDEGYFEEATAGSTIIPLITAWLNALGLNHAVNRLEKLTKDKLPHTTMQLWTADASSETHLYVNTDVHGLALCDLPIISGDGLLETIDGLCQTDDSFENLSAYRAGFWPVILIACRHWNLPVPPNFWINSLKPDRTSGRLV